MFLIGSSANFLPYLLALSFSLIFYIEEGTERESLLTARSVEQKFVSYEVSASEIVIQWVQKEADPIRVESVGFERVRPISSAHLSPFLLLLNSPHRAPPEVIRYLYCRL